MKRQAIVACARETIGTPYAQMDCAAVPLYVAAKMGLQIQRFSVAPPVQEIRDYLDTVLQRCPKADMAPGDVAWLRFRVQPTHFAVVGDYLYGGLSLIHASDDKSISQVIEHRLDAQWLSRIVAVWRYPGAR